MSKKYPWKARRLEILKFMWENRITWRYQLEQEFGLSYDAVKMHLWRLKKQGLIAPLGRGCWVVTIDGDRRLERYGY